VNSSHFSHGPREFHAPWSLGNRLSTALLLAILGVVPLLVALAPQPRARGWAWLGVGLLWLILGGVALFCVRGYALRHGELWIRRSFWWTRLSLAELQAARVDPDAFRGAIRIWGAAGFMAAYGWFYSKRLGRFRAWVTDPAKSVVLEFPGRTVVVSPDRPEAFVRALGFEPQPVRMPF